jgi:pseudouridine-5'-monophosphatase
MRVVWVPHPDVAVELEGKRKDVLAGRTWTSALGDEWQHGELDDGWAECIPSLKDLDYRKYGIQKKCRQEERVEVFLGSVSGC